MSPLSKKLKQQQIKPISIPSQCDQKDFTEKSGRDKALRLVVLPFPTLSMIVSKCLRKRKSVILE